MKRYHSKNECCSPRYVKGNDGKIYPVRCGKCIFCLAQDQLDWVFRNRLEFEVFGYGYYLTLTYDEENLKELNVKDCQNFFKLLRYHFKGCKIRTFYVGEYGRKSNRPHYHALIYGLPYMALHEMLEVVEDCWKKGFCYVKYIDSENIHYVCKYLTKVDPRKHEVAPFVRCHSALLSEYLTFILIQELYYSLETAQRNQFLLFQMVVISQFLDFLGNIFMDNHFMSVKKRNGLKPKVNCFLMALSELPILKSDNCALTELSRNFIKDFINE